MLTRKIGCSIDFISYILPSACNSSNSELLSDMSSASITYDNDVIMKETEQSKQSK